MEGHGGTMCNRYKVTRMKYKQLTYAETQVRGDIVYVYLHSNWENWNIEKRIVLTTKTSKQERKTETRRGESTRR